MRLSSLDEGSVTGGEELVTGDEGIDPAVGGRR
jgi:hypothetical protein